MLPIVNNKFFIYFLKQLTYKYFQVKYWCEKLLFRVNVFFNVKQFLKMFFFSDFGC